MFLAIKQKYATFIYGLYVSAEMVLGWSETNRAAFLDTNPHTKVLLRAAVSQHFSQQCSVQLNTVYIVMSESCGPKCRDWRLNLQVEKVLFSWYCSGDRQVRSPDQQAGRQADRQAGQQECRKAGWLAGWLASRQTTGWNEDEGSVRRARQANIKAEGKKHRTCSRRIRVRLGHDHR